MIGFAHPAALLLAPLVLLALRRRFLARPLVTTIRALLLLALVALVAGPRLEGESPGRDLVLLLDRSRSMPGEGTEIAHELFDLAAGSAETGDRIGLVLFGRDAVVERAPEEHAAWRAPSREVDPDATDLAGGIETAIALVSPDRAGSVLVISDGESTGRDPAAAARQALRRGVGVDVRIVPRPGVFDLAVEEVAVPGEVAEGEPFQVTVWIRSDRALEAPVTVRRDGKVIARGTRSLRRGLNAVRFRDAGREAGVHAYDVEVAVEGDRVAQNNRGMAAMRVAGPFRVLVVTPEGREDRLTRSLQAAGIAVVNAAPGAAPLSDGGLDAFRAVILEDVPLEDLVRTAPAALQRYVRDLGGGLLMTGGRASFGPGGYYRSAIEDVLPVTMEIRNEQRRFRLAMSIALDRSGSMAASAGSGTKMDLANLGACAAIDLLGRGDGVAVTAVDSTAHEVVPFQDAANRDAIRHAVRRIESMGGGIFVDTAIRAAAYQLRGAPQGTRHVVLFADAADAEEPGDYKTLVPDLVKAGVTVSVIGLGSDGDTDAAFLRDVARRGNGRCFFAADAADLPRVFAQETIQVARSSIVEEPTAVGVEPDLSSVGAFAVRAFPDVGGYSIAYLKPEARRGLVTKDDVGAPMLAFWQHGLGRSAAFLGEADGPLSGGLASWDGYADTFATLVRWLAGTEASDDVFATLERRGHEAVLTVEVAPGDESALAGADARVVEPDGTTRDVMLVQAGEGKLEGRVPMSQEGVYRPVLRLAGGPVLKLAPTALPYSPEFEPRTDPQAGEKTLRRIARIAEGRVDPPSNALFGTSRSSRGSRSLAPLFAGIALGLLLLEIATRRLGLRVPTDRLAATWIAAKKTLPRPRPRRRPRRPSAAAPDRPPPEGPHEEPPPADEPPPDDTHPPDITDLLARARRR